MTVVVLLILAALWAVVLVPPLLRARHERAADTVGDFHHRLGVLGRSRPGPVVRPLTPPASVLRHSVAPTGGLPSSEHMVRRRRDVVSVLAAAAVVTLAIAAVSGGAVWAVQILVDLALVSYLGLMAYYRREARLRAATLHYLPRPVVRSGPASDLALRRTAGS